MPDGHYAIHGSSRGFACESWKSAVHTAENLGIPVFTHVLSFTVFFHYSAAMTHTLWRLNARNTAVVSMRTCGPPLIRKLLVDELILPGLVDEECPECGHLTCNRPSSSGFQPWLCYMKIATEYSIPVPLLLSPSKG